MFAIPKKILIKSDGNVIEYSKTIKTKTDLQYEYIYIKVGEVSNKLGSTICFSEKDLLRLLGYSFEILKV